MIFAYTRPVKRYHPRPPDSFPAICCSQRITEPIQIAEKKRIPDDRLKQKTYTLGSVRREQNQ